MIESHRHWWRRGGVGVGLVSLGLGGWLQGRVSVDSAVGVGGIVGGGAIWLSGAVAGGAVVLGGVVVGGAVVGGTVELGRITVGGTL